MLRPRSGALVAPAAPIYSVVRYRPQFFISAHEILRRRRLRISAGSWPQRATRLSREILRRRHGSGFRQQAPGASRASRLSREILRRRHGSGFRQQAPGASRASRLLSASSCRCRSLFRFAGSGFCPAVRDSDATAQVVGDCTAGVTPVPIPNTVVKPCRADCTARVSVWESRSLPALNQGRSWKHDRPFSF